MTAQRNPAKTPRTPRTARTARTARASPSATSPSTRVGLVSASHIPSGSRTAAMTKSKTRALGRRSTRMIDPATTPGSVPAMRTRASLPPVCPCRQYRYSAPGVAITL